MRARYPDLSGHVRRDGVRIHYEVHGEGTPTLLLMPTWSIVHSRHWKAQIPYLARHYRVVTFDGRGNGGSDRPGGPDAYRVREYVDDAIAVMDATDTERAILFGLSRGAHFAAATAARRPERAEGLFLIAPAAPLGQQLEGRTKDTFLHRLDTDEGWAKYNQHYWKRDYRGFAEFFFGEAICEPHSTKQIEDCVGWAMETTPETLIDTMLARLEDDEDEGEAPYRRIRCPALVVHGDRDRVIPHATGAAVAETIGAPLVTLEGSGHMPLVRDPVPVNRLIRDFVDRVTGRCHGGRVTLRQRSGRPKRVLYLSSPIGLGHGRRDLAIARKLRELHPGLEIDWLAQDPVTRLLADAGERIHPASSLLANESAHITGEACEHDLHVFQALRRMDEIMVANFLVFQEAVEEGAYDLVVADEAWDVDHFWHEHPELKRSALAWFTDFVGYMPMPEGGDREVRLAADYNAEMIEHIERSPRVRDRAIFVGEAEDVVPASFGPGLPKIPDWVAGHFDFCGYVTGRDPGEYGDRAGLRAALGYAEDETVCVVTVGGSGVGAALLRRVVEAAPALRARLPELRMVAVAGPRIDPASLPQPPGVEVHGYVPGLDRHLAACDVAVVQGGLTTCMELTAAKVPFVYFPLRNHFEQAVHVRHRLERHGAGVPMDYDAAGPEEIADAIVRALRRPAAYREVDGGGAARAARLVADLL